MRKILLTIMTTLAVIVSGLAVAAPAQATYGDSRTCVTTKEFRAIKTGQSKARVKRILDGRGKKVDAKTRQYSKCASKSKIVRVTYNKGYGKKTAKVASKRVIGKAAATQPNPRTMSLAEFNKIQPGMTLAQVKSLVGGIGVVDSVSVDWNGQVETRREWNLTGCKYGYASVYFLDDVVDGGAYYKHYFCA